jgi:class 3 adenylate cyclase
MVRRRGDQRGLTTLLFTDIVNSTEVAVELGDRRWRSLQARHHAEVRRQLKRHGGHEVDTAGDGFFATFESPASGARCAFEIVKGVREIGLEVRAGLHFGEAELTGEKIGGIAVSTAQRVESLAGPGQVFATDTIVHLVAGSGLGFTDLGSRELKGVPGRWELFSLDTVDDQSIGPPPDGQQAAEYRLLASPVKEAPARRRMVLLAAPTVAVVLTAIVIFLIRRQSEEQPQAPNAGPAVRETVAVLDERSGAVLLRPPVGNAAGPIVLTAPQGRANQAFAWIVAGEPANGGSLQQLQQLDQANGAITNTIPHLTSCISPPGCLAEADGRVWFLAPRKPSNAGSQGALNNVFAQGIDLTTAKRVAPIRVDLGFSMGEERGFAAGDGALWIGDTINGKIYRLDLGTDRVRPYAIDGSVDDLAFGDGYVWVVDALDNTITRIDPRSGRTKSAPLNQSATLNSIGVGGGYLWITDDAGGEVWRVSVDLRSVRAITVGARPDDVVYAGGIVWVANYGDETVSKVDPGLAQETARYPIGIRPRALAVADGKVWVAGNLLGIDYS